MHGKMRYTWNEIENIPVTELSSFILELERQPRTQRDNILIRKLKEVLYRRRVPSREEAAGRIETCQG